MPSETPSGTPSDDIYDYSGELRYYLSRIDRAENIDPATKAKVKAFIDHVAANGAGEGRQAKYIRHLLRICELFGKPVQDVTRQDVERLMLRLREGYVVQHRGPNQGKRLSYSPATLADFVMVTKRLMKYVHYGNTDRDTPFPEDLGYGTETLGGDTTLLLTRK
jgi:uncharacterized protein (UPF0335 family)